ncbi:hypothetical protein EV356DRAFT_275304 [Viridothelium virens]|uniref:Uncharacterized protein n=1 Tax=Viridothelium virens TaxID=1048519 RepID=A0A6A6H1D5_VIRVR|nr:hypothetical protein EV356DRAFT_275304 [Viridothelium virens]
MLLVCSRGEGSRTGYDSPNLRFRLHPAPASKTLPEAAVFCADTPIIPDADGVCSKSNARGKRREARLHSNQEDARGLGPRMGGGARAGDEPGPWLQKLPGHRLERT